MRARFAYKKSLLLSYQIAVRRVKGKTAYRNYWKKLIMISFSQNNLNTAWKTGKKTLELCVCVFVHMYPPNNATLEGRRLTTGALNCHNLKMTSSRDREKQ